MSRRRAARRRDADQAAVESSLDGMRVVLSQALHKLIAEARSNPDPIIVAQGVANLVEAWALSALAMIDAASAAREALVPATAVPRSSVPTEPDQVRAAMLDTLRLIVEAARAGQPDVDADCQRFADTFSTCLRDAIAGAYLRTAAVFEAQLGLSPGIAN